MGDLEESQTEQPRDKCKHAGGFKKRLVNITVWMKMTKSTYVYSICLV